MIGGWEHVSTDSHDLHREGVNDKETTGVGTRWSQRHVDIDVERERSKSVVARYNTPR